MHKSPNRRWTMLPVFAALFVALLYVLPEWEPAGHHPAAEPPGQPELVPVIASPGQPGQKAAPAPTREVPVKPVTPPPKHQPLSQPVVEYHIQVELDAAGKKLAGRQTMTWKHPGTVPVKELYFHLYPNAFRSKDTTFNRESGGKLRDDRMAPDSFGSMELISVQTSDGIDLTGTLEYVQPDDGNEHDRSLMRVRLLQPVQPGGSVTLNMAFEVQLPRVYARMGYAGDFVMAGQWFPKIAVYEPKGRRGNPEEGWNLHQYHGNSEFYSDFAIYSVQIKVPEDYTVAATGFPTKPAVKRDGKKTYHFYADDVHDFAWAASPDFVYVEEQYATKTIPGLKIKLYLDPRHAHLKPRYLQAVKRSLDHYAEWFGTYPYSTLSVVVPPEGAGGAGGMEYPTLVTAWAADDENPGSELERVVVHEIAHQYFYGMIANNEFEEAWLDEGFASYAEDKVMESVYGIAPSLTLESSYITSPEPLNKHSWAYRNHSVYAENVYTRAKLVLYGIEREIGEKKMRQVMRAYYSQYRFKHPSTGDFQRVLEQVTKRSWDDYFRQFVYDGRMVDYAVTSIRSYPVRVEGEQVYENHIVIESRDGIHGRPKVLFRFKDGSTAEQIWDVQNTKSEFKIISRSPVEWAFIDPEGEIVLENKHINNFLKAEVNEEQNVKLNVGITKLLEGVIQWLAW